MRKLSYLIVLGFLFSSCSKQINQAVWQNKAVIADGNCDEWEIPLRYYDKKSTLQYNVTNDSVNLYFCIRAIDEALQMKIQQSGMEIWFDTLGGQEKQAGLFFPYIKKGQLKTDKSEDGESPGPIMGMGGGIPFMKQDFKTFKISGFKTEDSQVLPLENNSGIILNLKRDDFGILVYEAIIPFYSFYSAGYNGFKGKQPLGITFVIDGVQMPGGMRPENMNDNREGGAGFSMQGPGGMQMGGGGMQSGGMPGGGMPGAGMSGNMGGPGGEGQSGQQNNSQLEKPSIIQFFIQVAQPVQ